MIESDSADAAWKAAVHRFVGQFDAADPRTVEADVNLATALSREVCGLAGPCLARRSHADLIILGRWLDRIVEAEAMRRSASGAAVDVRRDIGEYGLLQRALGTRDEEVDDAPLDDVRTWEMYAVLALWLTVDSRDANAAMRAFASMPGARSAAGAERILALSDAVAESTFYASLSASTAWHEMLAYYSERNLDEARENAEAHRAKFERQRKEQTTAAAVAGWKKRLGPAQNEALRLASSLRFRSRAAAVKHILREHPEWSWQKETIGDWLKKAGWKPKGKRAS